MLHRRWAPLLSVLPLAACASTHALIVAPLEAGHERVYPDSFRSVVPQTNAAFVQAGLKIDTILNPDSLTLMIVAKKGASWFSYGELVRLLARPLPDGETSVRVYTMPRMASNLFYTRWDDDVFNRLGRELARAIEADTAARMRRWAPQVEILRSLDPQAGVRIRAARSRYAGAAFNDGDSVLVLGGRQRVPVATIDSVWLRKSHARAGAIVGSLAGAVAGALIARANNRSCSAYGECYAQAYGVVFVSSVGGAIAGAIIGSGFPKWKLRYP